MAHRIFPLGDAFCGLAAAYFPVYISACFVPSVPIGRPDSRLDDCALSSMACGRSVAESGYMVVESVNNGLRFRRGLFFIGNLDGDYGWENPVFRLELDDISRYLLCIVQIAVKKRKRGRFFGDKMSSGFSDNCCKIMN